MGMGAAFGLLIGMGMGIITQGMALYVGMGMALYVCKKTHLHLH